MIALGPNARRVIRDTLFVAPGYVVPGIASLIGVPILFRSLGATEYGLWSLINAIASGVPQLTTSSVEALTLRFGHRNQGRPRFSEWAWSVVGSAVLGAVLATIFVPGQPWAAILATAGLSAAASVYLIRIAGLQSGLRFGVSSAMGSFRAIVGLVLAALGAIATGTAIGATWGLTCGFAGAILASYRIRGASRAGRGEIALPVAAPVGTSRLSYGLASIVIAIGMFVLAVGDRFILSTLSGLSELGVYAAVYTVEDLVLRLAPSVLLVAMRPRIFRSWDGADSRRVVTGTAGMAAMICWVGLSLTCCIVLVGDVLGAPSLVARILGPIAFGLNAWVAASSIAFLYLAAERQWRMATHVVIAAVANVALNILWAPHYGAVGAAFATAISYGGLLLLHAAGFRRHLVEDRATVVLGLTSVGAMSIVGTGSAWSGGLIWPALGLLTWAALAPLSRNAVRALLLGIE